MERVTGGVPKLWFFGDVVGLVTVSVSTSLAISVDSTVDRCIGGEAGMDLSQGKQIVRTDSVSQRSDER